MITHKTHKWYFFKNIMSNILIIDQARRNNLRNYLEAHKDEYKSLTEFAKFIGVYVSNLSPIINGEKRFTDKLAETIEGKLNLPSGFLSSLSNTDSILIPFYKFSDKKNNLAEIGEFLELNKDTVHSNHQSSKSLFALKPNINIGRDAMTKSVSNEKILIFDKNDTQIQDGKIYLILFYGNLFLRRCRINADNIFFESDKPEIYSIITYGSKDVNIFGRLVYSAYLESF